MFRCEAGELEAGITLVDAQTPRIAALIGGARGVSPPPAVRAAAASTLALYHSFNAELFDRTFAGSFARDEMERSLRSKHASWGDCALEDVDIATPRGALFDLGCAAGPRLMKVELAPDDRIRRFFLSAPRDELVRDG